MCVVLCVCRQGLAEFGLWVRLQGVAEQYAGVWELSFTGFASSLSCVGAECAVVDSWANDLGTPVGNNRLEAGKNAGSRTFL